MASHVYKHVHSHYQPGTGPSVHIHCQHITQSVACGRYRSPECEKTVIQLKAPGGQVAALYERDGHLSKKVSSWTFTSRDRSGLTITRSTTGCCCCAAYPSLGKIWELWKDRSLVATVEIPEWDEKDQVFLHVKNRDGKCAYSIRNKTETVEKVEECCCCWLRCCCPWCRYHPGSCVCCKPCEPCLIGCSTGRCCSPKVSSCLEPCESFITNCERCCACQGTAEVCPCLSRCEPCIASCEGFAGCRNCDADCLRCRKCDFDFCPCLKPCKGCILSTCTPVGACVACLCAPFVSCAKSCCACPPQRPSWFSCRCSPKCVGSCPGCGNCCLKVYGVCAPCCSCICPPPNVVFTTTPVTGEWVSCKETGEYRVRAENWAAKAVGAGGSMISEVIVGLESSTSAEDQLAATLIAFMELVQDDRRPFFNSEKGKAPSVGLPPPGQQVMLGEDFHFDVLGEESEEEHSEGQSE